MVCSQSGLHLWKDYDTHMVRSIWIIDGSRSLTGHCGVYSSDISEEAYLGEFEGEGGGLDHLLLKNL